MDLETVYTREFLGKDEDMGDADTVRGAYDRLARMPVDTPEQARDWLNAWGEVMSAVSERIARAYFDMTKDTRDETASQEYQRLTSEILPLAEELDETMKRRFMDLPDRWVPSIYGIARQGIRWDLELFRKENLPLLAEDMNMGSEYQRISGGWETEFDGRKVTPKMLTPYLKKPDRALRERAWRAMVGMHLADRDKLDDLFERMLANRKKRAENADMPDFVAYQFKHYKRLSYDREDVRRFRDAIHRYVVPAVSRIMARRKEMMGLDTIRPWDTNADPEGAEPPRVYEDIPDLKRKVAAVLKAVDPEFERAFWLMDSKGYLDLENRPGKAPGAYSNDFAEERMALVFANAVGTSDDFDTLLHESGHAIHTLSSRHLPLLARSYPIEFAEVASMSMELLARPHWHLVYENPEDRRRIGRQQLEDNLRFLPFMAMLDEFQEWVYTHPEGADREARDAYWEKLAAKYMPHMDYSGLEDIQRMGWQYLHVFEVPLYYVEYGIAQMGALQVFVRSLDDYDQAVRDYKHALTLGSTVGLPELFEAAGVKFVMKYPEVLEEVTGRVMKLVDLA